MESEGDMSDEETVLLLRLLHRFVMHYDWTSDSISELASDIRMSQDTTSDEVEQLALELEAKFI